MSVQTHLARFAVCCLATMTPLGCGGASSVASRVGETKSARPISAADVTRSVATEVATGHEEPERQAQASRPGTLTAGSIDDHSNFAQYRDYVDRMQQRGTGESLPPLALGRKVVIEVVNGKSKAIAGAGVLVRVQRSPTDATRSLAMPVVLDCTTGPSGRTFFLTGMDADHANGPFRVEVTPPGGGSKAVGSFDAEQSPWRITLPDAPRQRPTGLDLALVIDTTGSMGDELEYLKTEIDSIAGRIRQMFPQVSQRLGLVVYRDRGDEYLSRRFDFTESLKEFRASLGAQRACGGGDYPEAMDRAVEQSAQLSWRNGNVARVLFLVADAPPHVDGAASMLAAVARLRQAGVTIFPIAGSGTAEPAEYVLRASAFLTAGEYFFLTDHARVGLPHAKPDVASYAVERLDQLMIRAIAGELLGRKIPPAEILDIDGRDVSSPLAGLQVSTTTPAPNAPLAAVAPRVAPAHQPAPATVALEPAEPVRQSRWLFRWASLLAVVFVAYVFEQAKTLRAPRASTRSADPA